MSTSERNPQRQNQQIFYQSQQPIQRIGIGSSPSMMETHHQHHGRGGYHAACECPDCESKLLQQDMGHSSTMDPRQQELYSYSLPTEQSNDDEDGIVHEFTTGRGERHVVIMTKNDGSQQSQRPSEPLSMQERVRRQKLSEAARNRYALLSEEEKRAVTERRIVMRQRRKQKEREMEELEAILRATNDITDDLIPIDEATLQRKRAKISRYQSMSIDERREYNQKRRLRQLGLPENVNEVNARKAEAARQRYHRMSREERKAYNRRRTESFRKRRVEEEKLLSTPAGQITPEALEKAQNIMLRNAKRAEQARLRYQKKQQEKGILPRRQRKPKAETTMSESAEPNLDQILDTIERDVVRKTQEARQALKRKQQTEPKKEEPINVEGIGALEGETVNHHQQQQFVTSGDGRHLIQQSPVNIQQHPVSAGSNVVQYVQVPAQSVQNGFLLPDGKFVQVHPESNQSAHQSYTLIQEAPGGNKFEGNNAGTSYYPVSVIQHESPQRQQQQQSTSGASMGHGHHHQRIEIVQPTIITTSHGSFEHLTAVPNSGGAHVIHYNAPPHHTHGQPYTIQLEQPMSHRSMGSSSSHRISIDANLLSPVDEKLLLQKAKRAERARRRYHEMSAEARHEFNAKRAHALKMARLRDEELCRLGDELSVKAEEPDEELRVAIDQARLRRAKRAEAARLKYQKMTSEQRKAHNAMRDAQRRQRKREIEDTVTVVKQ